MFHDLPVLPPLLIDLIRTGRWIHPGDDLMLAKVPFIHEPMELFGSDYKPIVSISMMGLYENKNELFPEYRGSLFPERVLPWIDFELALFLMANKYPGDDVGIALDYRTGPDSPRVIGTDWHTAGDSGYRIICETFDEFVELLDL